MRFYVGLHQPSDAHRFERCMVSVNRLRHRKSDFRVNEWMMDSGAFTEIAKHNRYRHSPEEYARQVVRWSRCGNLVAAVAQDFMCEDFVLQRRGMTVRQHQALTVARYLKLQTALERLTDTPTYILPVLQGYQPWEYAQHVEMYGDALPQDAWVGVGSVCKRNGSPGAIESVLLAIHDIRPDLRLHGFGVKLTSLASDVVRSHLYSADSMAWSHHERKNGRSANHWSGAARYVDKVYTQPLPDQISLFSREPMEVAR